VLKSCNLRRRFFFCALLRCISPLSSIVQANIFCSLNLDISLLPICVFKQTPYPKQVSLRTNILACSKFAGV
jgi:hypothetical protein